MDAYKTHGAFSWNELMTTDPEAAKSFYCALFGWSTREMDMADGKYTVVSAGEAPVGGIMKLPAAAQGMPPCWGSYLTVTDVDETVRKAGELGGRVIMPPFAIPNVGRMAVLQDPQGAVINVITYSA